MRRMRVGAVLLLVLAWGTAESEYNPDSAGVVFVSAAQVRAEIVRAPESAPGLKAMELTKEDNYSAVVVRRTKPFLAELHKQVADVWYVIDGGGTIVTGGALTEITEPSPGEVRGRGISGGTERQIGKGDVLKIPNGVPHWISKVNGDEIVYMVVKVSTPK